MADILIIGGVAAGMSAASRARRVSAGAHITVLERGSTASYGACGLPYFLSRRLPAMQPLIAHPTEFFRERRDIEVLTGHDVVEIEPGRRRVRVRTPGREFWIGYGNLVITTGARSRWRPESPGLRHVFSANTWDAAALLDAALQREPLRRIAVVGAGYIGLEVAEALTQRGLAVTLVDAHATPLHGFAADLVRDLEGRIRAAGIDLHLGTRVLKLLGSPGGRVTGIETATGVIATDAVVNCAGLAPETALAAAAGVALGRFGGITVDERQQTNLPGIFAAGDCAETCHLVTGAPTWIPLGAAANKQGRVAGQNAAGGPRARFPGVLGTLAVPLFGREWGRTGLSLEEARAAGFDAAVESVDGQSAAAYMSPSPVTLQIVYQPTTRRLLGCQMAGDPGTVVGRLDATVPAVTTRMRLDEIEMLDMAYSPALAPLYELLLIAAHNALSR